MPSRTPTYLVFGAYGGIGSALARTLSASGASLAVSGRDPQSLQELAAELGAEAFPADAADFAAVDDVVNATLERFGRLDGVANCVGSLLLKPAHMTKPEEWAATLNTNLSSAFAILRAAAKPLTKDGGGSLVFVSTAAASIGLPNHEAIAAAKGGIEALVRSAAATYGRAGLRVNAVAPGLVDTPLTARITGNEKARENSEAMHALRRLGTPHDVAEAIRWLLSGDTGWITGQTVGVDGGLGSVRSS
jgi:3-oxoacyl-[acyl-carrier protein] reductase